MLKAGENREEKNTNWQLYFYKIVHIRPRETENYVYLTKRAPCMKLSALADSNQKSLLTVQVKGSEISTVVILKEGPLRGSETGNWTFERRCAPIDGMNGVWIIICLYFHSPQLLPMISQYFVILFVLSYLIQILFTNCSLNMVSSFQRKIHDNIYSQIYSAWEKHHRISRFTCSNERERMRTINGEKERKRLDRIQRATGQEGTTSGPVTTRCHFSVKPD